MPASRVVDVLAEVFRTYGFDTCQDTTRDDRSGRAHRVDLLAQKHGMDVLVRLRDDAQPLDASAVAQHAETVHATGAYYGVVVNPEGFTEQAYRTAASHQTILWDRAALESLIGRAVLHEILSDPDSDPPIAEVLGVIGSAPFAATDETAKPPVEQITSPSQPEASTANDNLLDMLPSIPDQNEPIAENPASSPPLPPPAPTMSEPVAPADEPGVPDLFAMFSSDDAPTISTPTEPRTDHTTPDAPSADAPPLGVPEPSSNIEETNSWILESTRRVTPQGLDDHAANDPDPIPIQRTTASAPTGPTGLASLAALGGTRRHARQGGPDPRTFNPETGALLAPSASKESAAAQARNKIFTIDHTWLRYQPHRVLRWSVEAFVEGQVDTRTIEGTHLVDLATRDVQEKRTWQASRHLREGTFDVSVEHKPIRIDADKAQQLALDAILESTAREVTMEDYDASLDVVVTQKKRIRAHRDDVRLEDLGIHWCPIWCFKGVNGEIEVDGLTGQITEERLEQSDKETIIL